MEFMYMTKKMGGGGFYWGGASMGKNTVYKSTKTCTNILNFAFYVNYTLYLIN